MYKTYILDEEDRCTVCGKQMSFASQQHKCIPKAKPVSEAKIIVSSLIEDFLSELSFDLSSASEDEMSTTSSSCSVCQSILVCTKCSACVTTDPVFETVEIIENPIMNKLCDVQIVKDQVYMTYTDSSVVAMSSSKINVIDYDYVSRAAADYFPIVSKSQCDGVSVPLSDYRCKNNEAKIYYGHASGVRVLRKLIVDNSLRFQVPSVYNIVSFDIETYNETVHDQVPQLEDSTAHIAMISIVITKVNGTETSTQTHVFIYDLDYEIHVDSSIIVHRFKTEQQCAMRALMLLGSLQDVSFVLSFNGTSCLFNDSLGYDLPFILKRADLKLTVQTKILKMDDELNIKGNSITGILEFPRLMFVDLAHRLQSMTSQDQKNAMPNYKLESYLDAYGIQSKDDVNYVTLQKMLSTPQCDISSLVTYCVRDCTALLDLNNACGLIIKMLALTSILELPLCYTVQQTDANIIELYLQREYAIHGAVCCYTTSESTDTREYKGAYTDLQAVPNTVYKECGTPDFTSLYPNAIISINGCLLTVQPKPTTDSITVDTSDDDSVLPQVHFSKDQSVLAEMMKTMFAKRKGYQNEKKSFIKGSPQYILFDALQLATKLVLNTSYGVMGNRRSPLFWRPLAAAITAYGRRAITTARDVVIEHGHQFLFADTDSVFCVLNENVTNYSEFMSAMQSINDQVQYRMGSKYLVLECEEVVRSISFISGKKSYIALLDKDQLMKHWIRDCPVTAESELKIRGCSWATQSKDLRIRIKNQVRQFLTSDLVASEFYATIKESYTQEIQQAIVTGDHDTLSIFAERVKLSSEKSTLVQYLKSSYASIVDGQDYIQVVSLNGSGSTTFNKIPLVCVNSALVSKIDVPKLVSVGTAAMRKFLLCDSEKKQDKKVSSFKTLMQDLQTSIGDNEILVRIEKVTSGQTKYTLEKWIRSSVGVRISKMKTQSVHEVLNGSECRLFFDVDSDGLVSLIEQLPLLDSIVQKELGFAPMRRCLQSTGNKQSLHVYYDVNVSIQFAKHIATIAKQSICGIDLGVYRQESSLRLPNSIKIKDNAIVDRRFPCSINLVQDHLISASSSYPTVQQPLHTLTRRVIDPFYNLEHKVQSDDEKLVEQWLRTQGIRATLQSNNNIIRIQTLDQYICPVHKRLHDSDHMWAKPTNKFIKIGCFRMTSDEKKHSVILNREKDETVSISRIDALIQQCQGQMNLLNDAIVQSTRYLECDLQTELQTHNVVAIRSALGTGKSEAISKLLASGQYNKVLIVSHRHTFTQDVSKRYECVSYNDIQGSINLAVHKRVICQVESLHRVRNADQCLVIVDEIESILSQVTSCVAVNQQSHHAFVSILKAAKGVIVCDGFLQNETISMLKWLRNEPIHIVQNVTAPYQDHRISVNTYTQHCQSNVIESVMSKLNEGLKVACMITSSNLAKAVAKVVQDSGKSVALYHGIDLEEDAEHGTMHQKKKDELNSISEHWKVDCLIYTSTITAGVNFSENHFDSFIHVYVANTCDALSFVQGCFRVRQLATQDHELWFEEQRTDAAHTPSQLVYQGDTHYSTQPGEQLLLWTRARKEALEEHRSDIVMKCLSELGFSLTFSKSKSNGKVTKASSSSFLTVEVTEQDVDNYRKIQNNRDLIGTVQLSNDQAKKIVTLSSIGFEPTMTLNQETASRIMDQFTSLKNHAWIKKLTSSRLDTLESVLQGDQEARTLGTQMKSVDRTRLVQSLKPFNLYREYKDLLDQGEFTNESLPEVLKTDTKNLQILNQAASVIGKCVIKELVSRTKTGRVYKYIVSALIQ